MGFVRGRGRIRVRIRLELKLGLVVGLYNIAITRTNIQYTVQRVGTLSHYQTDGLQGYVRSQWIAITDINVVEWKICLPS